jgi:inorganic triphosphatase YgiF
MGLEVELKYRAAGPATLARLAAIDRLGPATLGPPRTAVETDRYLDTDDRRLDAARWACRLRSRGAAARVSLKGPETGGSGGALHRRPEVEGAADDRLDPDAWPPSAARTLLNRLRAGAPLVERFRLVQRRTEREVRIGEAPYGVLSLDTVRVEAVGTHHGDLHVVELELSSDAVGDDGAVLTALAAALASLDGLAPDERTKLEHALDLLPDP